ncbi:MAG TPA: PEP-CTERM sorting domain-containing protein [Candidatus Sulfotelmatobacter sp.]|nr:PEP-CTERM sorting domain-containing protein [Candidatus Sulfotelmatobacter sp.]
MTPSSRTLFTLVLLLLCGVSSALANSSKSKHVLTFIGLQNMQQVGNTYNGIGFSSNIFVLRSVTKGGSGAFAPDPTGTPIIFIDGPMGTTATGTINVYSGFTTGMQFFFTAGFKETVSVWSGTNGTGTILATLTLSPNNLPCTGFPSYCNWTSASLGFGQGTAKSITFTGPANGLGIADITLNQTTSAVPEPASVYLLGTGLAALGFSGIRRLWKVS